MVAKALEASETLKSQGISARVINIHTIKPIDEKIKHLEGNGGKIKFKIYPQSQDIKWAANTDAFSGSVWDASEKVNKDKKHEAMGDR